MNQVLGNSVMSNPPEGNMHNNKRNFLNQANNNTHHQIPGIRFVDYQDEAQLHHVMSLVGRDLSEPYSSK